jgi:hypothetical protein
MKGCLRFSTFIFEHWFLFGLITTNQHHKIAPKKKKKKKKDWNWLKLCETSRTTTEKELKFEGTIVLCTLGGHES